MIKEEAFPKKLPGDQRCSCQCHWDWGWLCDVFARGIALTNIDALLATDDKNGTFMLETKGFIVLIETKNLDETIGTGQRMLLEEFSKKPGCLSIILWGSRSMPEQMARCFSGKWSGPIKTDRQELRRLFGAWFEWADAPIRQLKRNPLSW